MCQNPKKYYSFSILDQKNNHAFKGPEGHTSYTSKDKQQPAEFISYKSEFQSTD